MRSINLREMCISHLMGRFFKKLMVWLGYEKSFVTGQCQHFYDIVPSLSEKIPVWLRYVNDTFTIIKKEEIENIKAVPNSHHEGIKFIFLDASVTRN